MTSPADSILRLLELRHSTDVFVTECKDGPTHSATHRRLDAWAMRKSWSNPDTFGYEIKVSRSDFLNDEKWVDYLPLCSQFYFVCPHGLIQPEELAEGCGLLWAAKTGTRLYAKRKAPRREVTPPESLWRYILMCRVRITRDYELDRDVSDWKRWLTEKHENQDIGHAVSERIAKRYAEMECELLKMKSTVKSYERIRTRIEELGFDPDFPVDTWSFDDRIAALRGELPRGFSPTLSRARAELERLETILTKVGL